MTAEASTKAGDERPPPADASPRQLMSEALWLGLILGMVLTVSLLERDGFLPGQGLLSSLLLFALALWHAWHFRRRLRWVRSPQAAALGWWAFSVVLCFLLLGAAWAPWVGSAERGPSLVQSAHLLLFVPLSEEFYFRGLLLEHLRRGFGAVRAVVLCTFLFALLHLPVGAAIVAGTLSVVACLLTLQTGVLGYAVQLHLAWNAFSQIQHLGDPALRWRWALSAVVLIVVLATCSHVRRRGSRDQTA
jgi:membrane protease YdiL (CAAX protease family)